MEGFAGALESRLSAFSYESLMPVGVGTPRYEDVCMLLEPFGSQLCHLLHPLDSGFRRNDDPGNSWESEPLSYPNNTIFVPMTNMRFADYRNGLGGLIVSTNCLSA